MEPVFVFQFLCYGLAHIENPDRCGIARLACADGFDSRILNGCGRSKVGFACTETHDVLAVCDHLFCHRVDGDCERCCNILRSIGKRFHFFASFFLCCLRRYWSSDPAMRGKMVNWEMNMQISPVNET